MGRHPKPNEEKQAVGTYRADRDKSVTIHLPDESPEMPLSLEKEGQRFWAHAYGCEWITVADQHQVQLVAEKKDERVVVAQALRKNPDDWRTARTLKDLDRDIQDGLAQLLMTPLARKRAGVVTGAVPQAVTKGALLMRLAADEITREEYDHQRNVLNELETGD